MLCKYCQNLKDWNWKEFPELLNGSAQSTSSQPSQYIEHQPTYSSLTESAHTGCDLCSLFKQTLQEHIIETEDRNPLRGFYLVKVHGHGDQTLGFLLEEKSKTLSHFFQILMPADRRSESIPGRQQGSYPNAKLALGWLRYCESNHPRCNLNEDDTLPSRLLYIEQQTDPVKTHPLIRLVDSCCISEQYLALSHCWGETQPLRTTKENYGAHKKGIAYQDLPQSFQDAVNVTSSLGFKYLWIDSLCIIQDLKEDWEYECPRMVTVYANARLTIAASDAANSSEGFLHPYPNSNRCDLDGEFSVRYVRSGFETPSSGLFEDEFTLLTWRAWTFQERLLSTRFLAFKADRMQWQCNTCYQSDDLSIPYKPTVSLFGGLINKMSISDLMTGRNQTQSSVPEGSLYLPSKFLNVYDYWLSMLLNYSRCNLTFQTDKLPALSGLANAISSITKDDYLAGMWKGDLVRSLCWYIPSHRFKLAPFTVTEDDSLSYRAPSWSWASNVDPIGLASFPSDGHQQPDLLVVSAKTEPEGLDPFGKVNNGTLYVKGKMKEFSVGCFQRGSSSTLKQKNFIGLLYLDNLSLRTKYFPDNIGFGDILVMLLLQWKGVDRGQRKDGSSICSRTWVGLALEKEIGEHMEVCRRVGLITVNYDAGEVKKDYGFDDCIPREIKIV